MINVPNEYDTLKKVIIHRPGKEIDRLTPDNLGELLFEDIPYLKRMQDEHDEFAKILKENDVEVLYLEELLKSCIQNSDVLDRILTFVCGETNQFSLRKYLSDKAIFNTEELIETLFAGLTIKELEDKSGDRISSPYEESDFFLIKPIPNSYFMRDPAAAIGNGVISSKMHYNARIRESFLVREILKNTESLKPTDFYFGEKPEENRPFTIEGGDVIVLSENAIAIGCSERTRSESIRKFATNVFRANSKINRVYEIYIPAKRAYMHLDTVFTVVDNGLVVAFPDVMNDIKEVIRYEPMLIHGDTIISMPINDNRSFNNILKDEFGTLTVINTGNNQPRYAAREQLADGTNVFAIAPSKVITYERNIHTNAALKANGVEILSLNGSELVRGLGGPRCMTMPIYRTSKT